MAAWVHQPGGPPLVPEETKRSLIYNDFLELVVSPPQAAIFRSQTIPSQLKSLCKSRT
jgi:hypothetical protein